MKTCCKCKLDLDLNFFNKNKSYKDGLHIECKECRRKYRESRKNEIAEYNAEYRLSMPETQREKYRASQRNYLENLPPEKIEFRKKYLQNYFRNLSEVQKQERSKYSKSYLKNNLHKHAAVQAKRRALKIMATPIWASKEIIDDYYLRATAWSKLSGEEFEVDHIVPLKSNVVCGLHCQQNLTILSRFENSSKGNRWWPDMPEPEPLK